MKRVLRKLKNLLKSIAVKISQSYFSVAKHKVECNVCNYKTNRFASNGWHLYTTCFNCGSDIRHRLLWATFEHVEDFSLKKIIEGKAVLHFAPEKIISDKIKLYTKNYKVADFLADGYYFDKIDFNIDISNMPDIKNESFDCVIACDVLEHVSDHIEGIKEVYRILKKGGHCIITVPLRDNLKITYEDLSITDPAERKKAFGQTDHLRIYGDDFSSLLEKYGFSVTVIDKDSFSEVIVKKNVLFPPVLSKKDNVTNFRKVFIGVK